MEWIDHLLPAVQNYGSLGYWIIFLVSFFEAFVFIGSFIPGTFIIIFYGFLAVNGHFNVGDLFILATLGAVLGDGASFYLGTKSRDLFHERNFLLNTKYLEKSQRFFNHHGNKSIFLGRFIGIIKPFIPFVAGLSRMNTRKFIFWNVSSAVIWAISHLAVGYFFGGAYQVIEIWSSRLGLFALICFIFFFALWFTVKKGERALEYTVSFVQSTGWSFINSFPIRWFYHHLPGTYRFLGQRLKTDSFWGRPFSWLIISFSVVVFLLSDITKNILVSGPVQAFDMRAEELLLIFRDSFLVKIFLWLTALGEAPVIVSLLLSVTAVFWLWKKKFYILPLWVAVIGSAVSSYFVKILINRARPGGNIPVFTENFFSFPSGHSALAIAVFGFLIYCFCRNFKSWRIRVNSFFVFGSLVILIGFSRLYLGIHFLSDVLGGYLIGSFWLLFGFSLSGWLMFRHHRRGGRGLIEEIRDEKQAQKRLLALRFVTGLLVFAEMFFVISFIKNFKPIFNVVVQTAERQVVVRDINDPLFERYIPKFPESLTGDYQAPLNFILVASDDFALLSAFSDSGWQLVEKASFKNFFQITVDRLRGKQSYDAPITPLFWHGRPNDFAFKKQTAKVENAGIGYAVRFWRTDIATEDGGYVYVGLADSNTVSKYIILRKVSPDLDVARNELLKDMLGSRSVIAYEKKVFVDNTRGQYYEKGRYNTDGSAYVVYLR